MWLRLQEDSRLTIITLVGVFTIPGVSLLGILRYTQGNIPSAILDLILVLIIGAIVVFAWCSPNTRLSGLLTAISTCGGASAASIVTGIDGLLWLYPCLTLTFITVPRFQALLINAVSILVVVVFSNTHEVVQIESFVLTALMLSICSYIYAYREEQQQERLRSLNYIDPLTGAKNRRAMDLELGAAVASFDRTGTPYALAMLDVDHFKSVNDRYGHSAGDLILKELVDIVRAHTRPYDQVYRYGGEEFFILLPNVDEANQTVVVSKLQHAIRAQLKTSDGKPVTTSFGVASLAAGITREEWQKNADQAMYKAKLAGRDTVIFQSK